MKHEQRHGENYPNSNPIHLGANSLKGIKPYSSNKRKERKKERNEKREKFREIPLPTIKLSPWKYPMFIKHLEDGLQIECKRFAHRPNSENRVVSSKCKKIKNIK